MLLADLAATSAAVAATRSRNAKVGLLADALRRMDPDEAHIGLAYLAAELPQGRIGVGWASVRSVGVTQRGTPGPAGGQAGRAGGASRLGDIAPASEPALTLRDVDTALGAIAAATGAGSRAARDTILGKLFALATEPEQKFLVALLLHELRQGALEGLLVDAVAKAAQVPVAAVRRAVLLAGDIVAVGAAALTGGAAALAEFRLTLGQPLAPMLAGTATSTEAALERHGGQALVDHKLDGLRVQVHRDGNDVAVFSRNLRDITAEVPTVVAVVRSLGLHAAILDGEALMVRDDGRPASFQQSMSGERGARELRPFWFDALHLDGEDLLDHPLADRADALANAIPERDRIARTRATDPATAQATFETALALGQEGVVVKALDSPYEAGRRGSAWLKVKPAHTYDLVVLAVEWGSGRRQGWLSNLHLGALAPGFEDPTRPPQTAGFAMVGKTFKGLTDAMLAWQTQRLLELEVAREGHVVHVRPELVVEIALDGVQMSSRYPGGIALRFARVKAHRPDKRASEADLLTTLQALRQA